MLVFIDESGKPHPNDATNRPVLCCVCIDENSVRELTHQVYQLKNSIFGNTNEIKSTDILQQQTIVKNIKYKKQFVDQLVDIACSHDIKVFAIIMKRPTTAIAMSDTNLPKQYLLLLKRVEYFCENYDHKKAILIFDEVNPSNDLKISICINNFLFKSKLGKDFDRILEMPLFVNSSITPAIQIADFFAGIIRIYYDRGIDTKRNVTNPFEIWIKELYNKIVTKTEDLQQRNAEFIEYGFFDMGNNF